MKILICSVNYAPELTATGKYTGELAEWLAKTHQVDVIAAPPHYPKWEVDHNYKGKGFLLEDLNGAKVMRVPCYIPHSKQVTALRRILMESSFTFLSIFWWIRILFSKTKYDVVIAVCPPMQTALWACIYKVFREVPYIFHIQDFQVDMALELGMIKRGFLSSLLYRIEELLLKSASKVTTITQAMLNRALKKGVPPDRLALFPNWSNIDTVTPSSHNNSFRTSQGYSHDDFVVLYSGGIGEKQGLEIVLDAAGMLKEHQKIMFLIVGNGGGKPSLELKASVDGLENVKFLDTQSLEVFPKMLCAANVHLIIQKSKAADLVMPSKLTNILASGRPAIATAFPDSALGHVIKEHDTGLLIEPERPEQLRDAILNLYQSPEELKRKGKNARNYAEQYLDINSIMDEFTKVLIDVTKSNQDKS